MTIEYSDFEKVEIRVGKIIEVEVSRHSLSYHIITW